MDAPIVLDPTIPDSATAGVTSLSVEDAYARIRQEIASAEAVVRSWKSRYNMLSPICRLPTELLLAIFSVLSDDPSPKTRRIELIAISHVCSYWRRVTLDCSNLWTNISFSSSMWPTVMRRRSRSSLLKVAINPSSTTGSILVPLVTAALLSHFWRIKELSIGVQHDYHKLDEQPFSGIFDLLNSPAPLLEIVTINFDPYNYGNRLHKEVFSGDCPRLTHIRLSDCAINWPASILANLQSFKYSRSRYYKPPELLGEQMIAALSAMHRLETLELCGNLVRVDSTIPLSRHANLSRLLHFHIEADHNTCSFLLDHLTYPPTTRIRCKTRHPNFISPDAESYISAISRLAEHLAKRMEGPFDCLRLDFDRVELWKCSSICLNDPQVPPQVDLEITLQRTPTFILEQLMPALLKSLPLGGLRSLFCALDLGEETWARHFGDRSVRQPNLGQVWGQVCLHIRQVTVPETIVRASRRVHVCLVELA